MTKNGIGHVSKEDLRDSLVKAGLLTIDDAADKFGIKRGTVASWAHDGHIYSTKVGRIRFVAPDQVKARAEGLHERSANTAKMRAALAKKRANKPAHRLTPPITPAPAAAAPPSVKYRLVTKEDVLVPAAPPPASLGEIRAVVKDAVLELLVEIGLVSK